MNKTIYVGIIGTVVLFISGVGIAAAVGHADDAKALLPRVAETTERIMGNVTGASINTDTRLSDDSDQDDVPVQVTGSQRVGEDADVSSFSRGDDEEGDDNESEDEDDDDRASRSTAVQSTTTSNTGTSQTTTTGSVSANTFTKAQVAAHASASSCYTTIGGFVYDLTSWIAQHPGGQSAILSLCGINGAATFNAQHGGQGNPAAELASLKIGTLVQ